MSRTKPALEDFEKLAKTKKLDIGERGKPWTNQRDINNFCGLTGCTIKKLEKPGLEPLIEKYSEFLVKKKVETRQSFNAKKIFDGKQIVVYEPEDREASCHYGQGTQWCTASIRSENMFEDYHEQGPLYILIPKRPEYPNEKYQLHPATGQYMDRQDEPVTLKFLIEKYPEMQKFLNTLEDITVTSLDDLKYFDGKNISKIIIESLDGDEDEDEITDLSSLNGMEFPKLVELILTDNKITDLSPLNNKEFPKLEKLSLSYNQIQTLFHNIKLPELVELYLSHNGITDLSPLNGMEFPKLEKLHLYNNRITDLSPLNSMKFPQLKELTLGKNKIIDLSPLTRMKFPKLVELDLSKNRITDISPLYHMNFPCLQIFNITYNPFRISTQEYEKLKNIMNSAFINLPNEEDKSEDKSEKYENELEDEFQDLI